MACGRPSTSYWKWGWIASPLPCSRSATRWPQGAAAKGYQVLGEQDRVHRGRHRELPQRRAWTAAWWFIG